jgi:hypothetical protein
MQPCQRQEELRQAAKAVLQTVEELSAQQLQALNAADYNRLLKVDKQLERYFGKKQRAFGALLNHCREHGCPFNAIS